jgi:hypothetical protein
MQIVGCIRALAFAVLSMVIALGIFTKPARAQSGRYVNPLSIESSRSVADPTVLGFHGKYYLYLSGGAVWVSDDLVSWKHEQIQMPAGQRQPTAPNAFEYKDSVYISGNDSGVWKASNPVGPSLTLAT